MANPRQVNAVVRSVSPHIQVDLGLSHLESLEVSDIEKSFRVLMHYAFSSSSIFELGNDLICPLYPSLEGFFGPAFYPGSIQAK